MGTRARKSQFIVIWVSVGGVSAVSIIGIGIDNDTCRGIIIVIDCHSVVVIIVISNVVVIVVVEQLV